MLKKRKILIIVDWFYPGFKAGGPIQSSVNLSRFLKDEFEVVVLTGDRDLGEEQPYTHITADVWTKSFDDTIPVYYAGPRSLKFSRFSQIIKEVGADVIHLNHMFSPRYVLFPVFLKVIGQLDAEIVLCPRGAFAESALSIKKSKKKYFLWVFRFLGIHKKIKFHATTEREKSEILKHFPRSVVLVASNLPDTNFPSLQKLEKRKGQLNCIYIARIHPIKNLLFFLEILRNINGQINFTIVGPIEDSAYWDECLQTIDQLPSNITIDVIGPVPNENLIAFLNQSHLFVLPTTGENFGHSIFESMRAGRPVLISDQTPWQNLEEKQVGWGIPLSDMKNYESCLEIAVNWNQVEFDKWSKAAYNFATDFIKNPEFKNQYHHLFS